MSASHNRLIAGILLSASACIAGLSPFAASQAETVSYEYDALGRLVKVDKSDGTQTIYTLDAAGNRTQVQEGVTPSAPASITVPSSSTSGSYTISWTAPTSGTIDVYELYESTSSSFSSQTRIYSGTATSRSVSGKGNGTYYYRVRACSVACGGYRAGSNGVAVTLPPAVPGAISLPTTSDTGSYTVSWGPSSSGTVTAYELYEANSSSFTGQIRVHNGIATSAQISGRGDGTFYYRARACNGSACSGYTASRSISITIRPSTPSSIGIPSSSSTGSYTISWGTSTGPVTAYQLEEATNSSFTGATQVYSGTATSIGITGRGNGSYYYRVRACNGASTCSNTLAGAHPVNVLRPPDTPSSISAPSSNNTGVYNVILGGASGVVTAYEVYESTNSGFSPQTLVHNSINTSVPISGRANGAYYYRARACNSSGCSGFTQTISVIVALPPSAPGAMTIPSSSGTGSYPVSWNPASGNVTAYELQEATTQGFTNATLIYSGAATTFQVTGRGNGNYWYRVIACNGPLNCGGTTYGPHHVSVTLPPSAPASITVPATSNSEYFTVSWTAPTGQFTRYELWEATNSSFSDETRVLDGDYTQKLIRKTANGTFYYRVRACNGDYCGPHRTGSNPAVVSLMQIPPPVNRSTLASALTNICSWRASWGSSTGATYYTFLDRSGQVSLTTSSRVVEYSFCGLPYYSGYSDDYRPRWVRACNSAGCSERTYF